MSNNKPVEVLKPNQDQEFVRLVCGCEYKGDECKATVMTSSAPFLPFAIDQCIKCKTIVNYRMKQLQPPSDIIVPGRG